MEYLESIGTVLILLERLLTTTEIFKRMTEPKEPVTPQQVLEDDDELVKDLLRTLIEENIELRDKLNTFKAFSNPSQFEDTLS